MTLEKYCINISPLTYCKDLILQIYQYLFDNISHLIYVLYNVTINSRNYM